MEIHFGGKDIHGMVRIHAASFRVLPTRRKNKKKGE